MESDPRVICRPGPAAGLEDTVQRLAREVVALRQLFFAAHFRLKADEKDHLQVLLPLLHEVFGRRLELQGMETGELVRAARDYPGATGVALRDALRVESKPDESLAKSLGWLFGRAAGWPVQGLYIAVGEPAGDRRARVYYIHGISGF